MGGWWRKDNSNDIRSFVAWGHGRIALPVKGPKKTKTTTWKQAHKRERFHSSELLFIAYLKIIIIISESDRQPSVAKPGRWHVQKRESVQQPASRAVVFRVHFISIPTA